MEEIIIDDDVFLEIGKILYNESINITYDNNQKEIEFKTKNKLNIINGIKIIENFLQSKFLIYDIIYTNNKKIEFNIKESFYLYSKCIITLLFNKDNDDNDDYNEHNNMIKFIKITYILDINVNLSNKKKFECFFKKL